MSANTLTTLCEQWLMHKAAETRAAAARVAVENDIILVVGRREEGAQSTTVPGFKLTITGKLIRKMDWAKWETVKARIPEVLHPVKLKPELDATGVKWLAANRPELYTLLPIEVKPAKTAVEVERVEEVV